MSAAVREHGGERGPDPSHVAILQQRAAQLARVPQAERPVSLRSMLIFRLGSEQFAIDAARVRAVIVLRDYTPLPGVAPPLFGVTFWRGEILTILDLRDQLAVRSGGLTDLSRLVIVDAPERPFGVLADAVRDMVDIDVTRLRAADDAAASALLIAGITDDAVTVLDADRLIATGASGL